MAAEAVFLLIKGGNMAYDGITFGNRVDHTTERKLHAKVVDNILNSRTFFSRVMGMGKSFVGKTYDYTIKITDSAQGEFVSGMEELSMAASDTTIQLKYAHTAFAQPIVLPMLESFANVGEAQTIDLDMFKMDEAVAEAVQKLGTAIYGTGSGDQPLGLEAIVDDGTNVTTIGGQTKSTYDPLDGQVTASGGTMSLAKLGTLDDDCSATGIDSEAPTINLTTKTVWALFEQLLQPQVRADYASVGYNALPVRGDTILKTRAALKGAAGFTALTHRGVPVIKDDACTSGVWYKLNENYLDWRGRTIVPSKFRGKIRKVSLGAPSTMEGVAAAPSKHHGWFVQELQMMPHQAGMVGRYWVIGQYMASQPRRNGKLTAITGI